MDSIHFGRVMNPDFYFLLSRSCDLKSRRNFRTILISSDSYELCFHEIYQKRSHASSKKRQYLVNRGANKYLFWYCLWWFLNYLRHHMVPICRLEISNCSRQPAQCPQTHCISFPALNHIFVGNMRLPCFVMIISVVWALNLSQIVNVAVLIAGGVLGIVVLILVWIIDASNQRFFQQEG
ncbi:hypothetical protein BpHYR1_048510 [Brachionus plicatilis]|uniref:Uncharacterized protein n=1 Tax=Brachionus plicatilis TaxID=10195 RepID=A0A3M7SD05_BRAPC|nr:hypothetical protein BpHYR1_048510 [Brachionus plicatilis]